jgi:hypothetical protein
LTQPSSSTPTNSRQPDIPTKVPKSLACREKKPGNSKSAGQEIEKLSIMYQNSNASCNKFVFAYGGPSGRILGHEGWHHAYDITWSRIGPPWSTEQRALHAIGQHALLSIYRTYAEALMEELSRGLVALDQDPANQARLARCNAGQIREIAADLCARAWQVVHRLYPDAFDRDVPNPWRGVTKDRRTKAVKPAVNREQVYIFANVAIAKGYPEAAAAAVICFEWLQRPENVLAGFIRWTDYRGREAPTAIRITHHKTGAVVLHPLEETVVGENGKCERLLFYSDAEAVLARLPRRGIPMILHETRDKVEEGKPRQTKLYSASGMAKLVRRLREVAELPATFTLDACRHGGMTELEEAELTDGQGRALSAHKSRAYEGYAKRTMERALAATRKRHAHRLANTEGTNVQNEQQNGVQNDIGVQYRDAK